MRAGRWTRSIVAGALGISSLVVVGGAAGASDASDQEEAAKLVLTKADVAKARVVRDVVVGTPGDSTATPSDAFDTLAACVGKPIDGRAVVAAAHGPRLDDKTLHSEINSSVDIVETDAMATADRAVVKSRAFPRCVAQLAQERGSIGTSTITSLDARRTPMKHYGDYSTALLLRVKGANNGKPTTYSGIEVLTLRGRAELTDEFLTDSATPFTRKTIEKVLDKLAKRIDAARV